MWFKTVRVVMIFGTMKESTTAHLAVIQKDPSLNLGKAEIFFTLNPFNEEIKKG